MDKYTRLKEGLLEARKAKETIETNLLTTLLGEVQNKLKGSDELPSVIIEQVAKRFKKNIEAAPQTVQTDEELFILKTFLPQQLTKSEIIDELNLLNIKELSTFGEKMGKAMFALKNKVDGKVLGDIIRMEF